MLSLIVNAKSIDLNGNDKIITHCFQCVPIQNGFPGSEVGYVTVASVLMLMKDVRELANKEFIDPRKFRETERTVAFDAVFSGANIIIDNEESPKTSLRRLIYEQFEASSAFSDFESLLDTYEVLLKYRMDDGISTPPRSPLEEHESDNTKMMQFDCGEYICAETGKALFSTDALRIVHK